MQHRQHTCKYNPGDKGLAGAKLKLKRHDAHGRDTLIDIWPEGPPDKKVGMVEALGKAWPWRMPPQKWMPSTTTTSHQPERQ